MSVWPGLRPLSRRTRRRARWGRRHAIQPQRIHSCSATLSRRRLIAPGSKVNWDAGSQVELLEKSRCFKESAVTCLTCHDVHSREHDLSSFSQRCLSCHKPQTAMFPKLDHQTTSNCIDCHMPKRDTNLIVFDWNGRKSRPQVRSHWIKVYRATTRSN